MDYLYIILVVPAIIFTFIAQISVKSTFKKYNKVRSANNVTAAMAARRILDANGLHNVAIGRVAGELTDHYDPRNNTIFLSDSTYDSPSVAAIGVAAHEAGHAVQHGVGYDLIRLRSAIIPITNIGSKLSIPLIIAGLALTSLAQNFIVVAEIGVLCFALSTFFQLVTVPVEFNASNRAMKAMESTGLLDRNELKGARKTLNAAAMTYVAALAVSAMQLLRFVLMIAGAGGRRRD